MENPIAAEPEDGITRAPSIDRNAAVSPCGLEKNVDKSILDEIMRDSEDFKDDVLDERVELLQQRWGHDVKSAIVMQEATKGEAVLMGNSDKTFCDGEEEGQGESLRKLDEVPVTQRKQNDDYTDLLGGEALKEQPSKSAAGQQEDHRKFGLAGRGQGSMSVKARKRYPVRYFIIKSLNHHNIAKSIERGIWATQQMNEPTLNEAFETSEKVILVFSVNMSGHFQGYAQMTSSIGRQRANVWNEAAVGANPWGGTFSVEWLRLYDLPFQMTVHLKNPLNFYKPVKISRDGQELTAEIGAALCTLIDEGAERERPKRKNGSTQVTVSDLSMKRLRGGHTGRLVDSLQRPQVTQPVPYATRHVTPEPHLQLDPMFSRLTTRRAAAPMPAYGAEDVPFSSPYPEPLPSWGEMGRAYQDERQRFPPSRSLSSRSASLEPDWEVGPLMEADWAGEVEGAQKALGAYHWRGPGSSRSSMELPEEELLSMTYEEYLARVGSKQVPLPYEECSRVADPFGHGFARGVRAAAVRVRGDDGHAQDERYHGYGAFYGKHFEEVELGNKGFNGRDLGFIPVSPEEAFVGGWSSFEEGPFSYGGRNGIHYG